MQHPPKIKEKKSLSVRWLLLGLAVAAVAVFAAVRLMPVLFPAPSGQRFPDPEPNLTYETLAVHEPDQLSSVTIAHQDGESYTLRYQSGALFLEQDGELLDINDSLCADLLEAVTTIAVEDVVTREAAEVAEHLPDMGLEPPRTTVTVRYGDGGEQTLYIGANVPNTTYSYYRWSGDGGVYMCDAGVAEIFAYTANRLLPVTQPSFENSLVDGMTITNAAGTLEISLHMDASGTATGSLLSPVAYPLSGDAATALINSLENFRLGTLLGDAAAPGNDYGFDSPLCTVDIHQGEGMFTRINDEGQLVVEEAQPQQLRFVFGRAEGEYFYTCAYEGRAYLVSRFLVEPLIAATSDSLMTSHPADLGSWPKRIEVETDKGAFTVEIAQNLRLQENGEPELNEDEEWIYDTTATLNGETMAAEQAEALINRLAQLSFAGSVPEGWLPGETPPRWTIRLTAANGTLRTLTAYRLDAFSDAVSVDSVILHYCYIEALESALGDLMP